jgi:hypothetical protein
MTPCSPLSVNRRFEGTYRLHLQGQRNKFSKKPASKQVARRKFFAKDLKEPVKRLDIISSILTFSGATEALSQTLKCNFLKFVWIWLYKTLI